MNKENFYIKLIQRVKSGVRASRIPKSFSKKKNNVFSNEQHIVIQVLMQLEGKRLRDMPSFLDLLQSELHLPRAIHFTTINKFGHRIKQTWLELFIARMVVSSKASLVAIDGTGFSLHHRSPYFCTIAGERNRFMQTVVAAEVKQRLIIAARLRRKKRNEKNHVLAEKYRAKFIAPLKIKTKQYHRIRGIHRKKLFRNFPKETYNQRVIIESIFSAIKRRFGDTIYAKKFNAQKNELLFKIIAYNAEKLVNRCILQVYFLQSLNYNNFLSSFKIPRKFVPVMMA